MEYSGRGGIHREERKPMSSILARLADRQPAPNTTPSARPMPSSNSRPMASSATRPRCSSRHGLQLDEVRGRHHAMFLEPGAQDSAAYRQFWKELLAGRAQTDQFRRLGKNGREAGSRVLLPHPRQRRRGARRGRSPPTSPRACARPRSTPACSPRPSVPSGHQLRDGRHRHRRQRQFPGGDGYAREEVVGRHTACSSPRPTPPHGIRDLLA